MVVLRLALIATTAVIAQPSAGDTSKSDANKQICRVIADTGSRLGRYRACHTAQEWIELRAPDEAEYRSFQNARPWNTG